MPFQDSCYSKLGGRAHIFHLHYGLTDMIMDPIPVFMKNLQHAKDVLQLWLHNRQLWVVDERYTEYLHGIR